MEMMELAERYEAYAERTAMAALNGYDNMRHGETTLKASIQVAANAFAVAAALRSRAMKENGDHGR